MKSIFIVGLPKSGTTLLWTLFRNIPEVTTFYEPFAFEFRLQLESPDEIILPAGPQDHHFFVNSYFDEYLEYCDLKELQKHYCLADNKFDRIKSYIDYLIKVAPKLPTFKFVRLNGRLHELKAAYPDSYLIYIHREFDYHLASLERLGLKDAIINQYKLINQIELTDVSFTSLYNRTLIEGKTFSDYIIKYDDLVTDSRKELFQLLEPLGFTKHVLELLPLIVNTKQ